MHAWSLADNLQKIGYDVTVLCRQDYADHGTIQKFNQDCKFRIVRIRFRIPFLRFFEILCYLNILRFDSLVLSGRNEIILGGFVLNLKSFKTTTIIHGYEPLNGRVILKQWIKRRLKKVHNVVCVSRFAKENVLKLVSVHCQIIPNGINFTDNWNPETKTKRTTEEFPVLLTVGNMTRRKGQHRVIKALPHLILKFPNLKYNIVGLPTLQHELKVLAKKLNVEKHIKFTGLVEKHEDLKFEYRNADVFIILSENQSDGDVEGFGIVALEANFLGLPVIGARGCGIEDAVDDGTSGFLVDGNNANEIRDALEKALDTEYFKPENAITWAKKHHWSNIILDYDRII